ncbi:aldose epimerase family protein [Reinekea sp. G2M2-21]|uniref:aldose epimerase family protein n=1 Tax=Reinekea sp. G2M2-21 TaxID=2788942 RepID=UPI0018A8EE20|nr:aldose epimerase family protein [Reinekea sp. G2M2-21]
MRASISEVEFGTLDDGSVIKKFLLRNSHGTEASFLNLGASWIGFKRQRDSQSLVLGCDDAQTFAHQHAFLGSTVGRWANRIGHGQAQLNGERIQVEVNLPPHHLHGGSHGFSFKLWESRIELADDATPTLTFSHFSPDGEGGFPGNLKTTVKITLTDDDTVRFEYHASTDAPTLLNLTNHAYFNLDGETSGSLRDHEFKLASHQYLEADDDALPTGRVLNSSGTVLDFANWTDVLTKLTPLCDEQLIRAGGIDHCFCYPDDQQLKILAQARHTGSNTQLTCRSTLPGMQFYTGNFLGGTPKSDDTRFATHGAFCFEPGYWPDSPNHEHFPDCTISPEKDFSAIIEYSFDSME